MRLLSITVRNYRLHRDLCVELDPALTLIGGPNESGKSTLIEAAHRALFLRAKGNTRDHRAMESTIHGGHPEVEVAFEAGGRSWRIQKRFSGASGTAKLTESGGRTVSGDEAEARLRELLGLTDESGKPAEQWAHLWVWQGRAGDDPAKHANSQRDALVSRLQHEGGGAAMQSALDARVAAAVAQAHDAIFKQNGEPKAGSALSQAQAEAAEADGRLMAAREAAARLEQAVRDFSDAEAAIKQSDRSLEELRPQQDAVEQRAAQLAVLSGEEKTQALTLTQATERFQSLVKADTDIAALRDDIRLRQESLAPGKAAAVAAAEREAACRQGHKAAEHSLAEAAAAVRTARLRSELAAAHGLRLEKLAALEQLRAKQEDVTKRREALAALESKLAQLPAVDAARLKKLQALDGASRQATAALEAMAARIEVIESTAPVHVDGEPLAAGGTLTLTEDSEIAIGGTTRLHIRPGGGTSLTEARQRVQDADAMRQQALDGLGLRSVTEAVELVAQRHQFEVDIQSQRAHLEGMGASSLESELSASETAAIAAEADVRRRAESVPDFTPPENTADAARVNQESRQQLQAAESAESAARATREAAATAMDAAVVEASRSQKDLESARQEIADREAQLKLLLATHGHDGARVAELARRQAARDEADTILGQTKKAIAALQPEHLEADRTRLARAVKEQMEAKAKAEQQRAGAQSLLRRDGISDPQADLAVAEARVRSALERSEAETRRAQAVKQLHQLFQAEQQALADRFTAPLARKISGYLECLFGPGARAEVKLKDNEFAELQLVRPAHGSGAFDFDALSGGAKEQLAAAVRLAMAEVLAEAHEGCLPVVFDDAFAYADPQRVHRLQRMLDLAASRGLQVIVLTCTPGDYAALGAKQRLLSPAA